MPETEGLIARMDKRVLNEIDAVLADHEKQVDPGLAERWIAAIPEPETTSLKLMADWVAMLYYGRKVVRCLDGLRKKDPWSPEPSHMRPASSD